MNSDSYWEYPTNIENLIESKNIEMESKTSFNGFVITDKLFDSDSVWLSVWLVKYVAKRIGYWIWMLTLNMCRKCSNYYVVTSCGKSSPTRSNTLLYWTITFMQIFDFHWDLLFSLSACLAVCLSLALFHVVVATLANMSSVVDN